MPEAILLIKKCAGEQISRFLRWNKNKSRSRELQPRSASAQNMLENLPLELRVHILRNLTEARALARVSLSCTALRAAADPTTMFYQPFAGEFASFEAAAAQCALTCVQLQGGGSGGLAVLDTAEADARAKALCPDTCYIGLAEIDPSTGAIELAAAFSNEHPVSRWLNVICTRFRWLSGVKRQKFAVPSASWSRGWPALCSAAFTLLFMASCMSIREYTPVSSWIVTDTAPASHTRLLLLAVILGKV